MAQKSHIKQKKLQNKLFSEQRRREKEADKLWEEMAQITCLFIQLEASFIDLEIKVEELRNEVSALKKSKNDSKILTDGKYRKSVVSDKTTPSKDKISEWLLRWSIRRNIVIFRLHEEIDDENLVKTLFSDLGINFDNVTAVYRMDSRPSMRKQTARRPLIVEFADINVKDEALSKAKNIHNHSKWKGINMKHQLTKLQLQERKRCREFLNAR